MYFLTLQTSIRRESLLRVAYAPRRAVGRMSALLRLDFDVCAPNEPPLFNSSRFRQRLSFLIRFR